MFKIRSFGFIAASIVAASATTIVCFGDALGLVAPATAGLEPGTTQTAPVGATTRPLNVLDDAEPWLNAVPGGTQSLRGKVVVVNFWTYSCINSLRALPYLRAWSQRYADKGLVVIGVHAPEFEFEKDPAKVRAALQQLAITYPNVQDNAYGVWQRFGNEGWPGFYFIDTKGRVRGYRVGEGNYGKSEQLIRELLVEAGQDLSNVPASPIASNGIEKQADWYNLGSPEAYVGFAKAADFASPGGLRKNASATYTSASMLFQNGWDLAGRWTVGGEFATFDGDVGTIRRRFHARDAHMVLGGAADGRPVRFKVTIDGRAPGRDHGVDVDANGWGEVKEDRLYQLIRQTGAIGDHTVTVEFSHPGVRAYSFTFG